MDNEIFSITATLFNRKFPFFRNWVFSTAEHVKSCYYLDYTLVLAGARL